MLLLVCGSFDRGSDCSSASDQLLLLKPHYLPNQPIRMCFLPAAKTMRGTGYCEVLPFTYLAYSQKDCKDKTSDVKLTVREVYVTMGHSDCPQVSDTPH